MCAADAPHDVAPRALRDYSMIEVQGNLALWNGDRPAVTQCIAQGQSNLAECGRIVRGVIRRAQIGRFRVQRRRRHTAALPLRIGVIVGRCSPDNAKISDLDEPGAARLIGIRPILEGLSYFRLCRHGRGSGVRTATHRRRATTPSDPCHC